MVLNKLVKKTIYASLFSVIDLFSIRFKCPIFTLSPSVICLALMNEKPIFTFFPTLCPDALNNKTPRNEGEINTKKPMKFFKLYCLIFD